MADPGSSSHCKDLCCGCLCHHAQAVLVGQLHTLPSNVLQGSQGCNLRAALSQQKTLGLVQHQRHFSRCKHWVQSMWAG